MVSFCHVIVSITGLIVGTRVGIEVVGSGQVRVCAAIACFTSKSLYSRCANNKSRLYI